MHHAILWPDCGNLLMKPIAKTQESVHHTNSAAPGRWHGGAPFLRSIHDRRTD